MVRAVALNRDGRLLASGGVDGSVKLWDAPSGAALRTLRADRRYARMDITGLTGVTDAQRGAMIALGAIDRSESAAAHELTGPESSTTGPRESFK
jgi:WD40 repeat protein